ncbi:MAG: hypothetical protein AAGK32_06290, partial [Actinomycetota bacterium]
MSALDPRHLRATAIGLTMVAMLAVLLEARGAAGVVPVLCWALLAPGLSVVPAHLNGRAEAGID